MRVVRHRYVDPLDAIWLAMARGFGLEVSRSSEVYASTDGRGALVLGTPETLDADDCLAQMIFHELCHAAVQAPEGLVQPDWGLDNESERDVVREHACLRLQAALAGEHGLREVLAPTTDFRAFYDSLPEDALAGDAADAVLARVSLERIGAAPFAPWVQRGLESTARVLAEVKACERSVGSSGAPSESDDAARSLHRLFDTRPRRS